MEALAAVVVETNGVDFSVQQVADRAGVTHRTIYNHFPTRESLRDGLAEYVERRMGRASEVPDKQGYSIDTLVPIARDAYATFTTNDVLVRAYVLFMIATRGQAQVASRRTVKIHQAIETAMPKGAPISAQEVTAAVRMFLSAVGWHLLTEHYGLTPEQASATATWAARAMLDAARKPSGRR